MNPIIMALAGKLSGAMNVFAVAALTPEIVVGSAAIIFLIGGVFAGNKTFDRMLLWLGFFTLLALLTLMVVLPPPFSKQILFSQLFIDDTFSRFVKFVLVVATALILALSDDWLTRDDNQRFEYLVLVFFSLLGMFLMVSANDLLSLYAGLELSSLPLYVLASFSRNAVKSTESGLKYFVLGSLASGMILFGASLVYGFAGTTNFASLALFFTKSQALSVAAVFGLVLVLVGLCFKVSAAPFHMWTPDVYEGAPTPVTAFFSVAPKIAAIALFVRIMVQPFAAAAHEWQQVVIFVSALSMIVGAFGALQQTNIKRLLAYSSIGHVGYALMGLAANTSAGVSSILIYFVLYIAMSVGAFACILMMRTGGKPKENISDLAGLSKTSPLMAACLAVFMFSMAGIPPLAGFFGKLYVFLAAIKAGLYLLAVVGVLSSVVACFYYLKVIKVMYFDESKPAFDASPLSLTMTMAVCAVVTLLFFAVPTPLVSMTRAAAEVLFQ